MTTLDALIPITEAITGQVERLHSTICLLSILNQRLTSRGNSLADIPFNQIGYIGNGTISFSTKNHEETTNLLRILGGQWDKEPYVSGSDPYVHYRQRLPDDDDAEATAVWEELNYNIHQTGLSPGCTLVEEDVPPSEVKPQKRYRVVCNSDPASAPEEVQL